MNKSDTKQRKKTKRRAYESLLLLLLTISLFITATFAWFTDSAFSKGNKVFAGNLYIDILADAEDLEAKYNSAFEDWKTQSGNENKEIDDYLIEELDCEPYTRKYLNPNYDDGQPEDENNKQYIEEKYYITTGTEAGGINLYNMEPGQVRKLDVKYVNTGDLAFKAGGALKFDYDDTTGEPKSYTGLETLNQQKEQETEIYRNNYAVGNGNGTVITTDVFVARRGEVMEATESQSGETYIVEGFMASVYFENKNNNERITIKELCNLPILDIIFTNTYGNYAIPQNVVDELKQQYIGGNYFEKVENKDPSGNGNEHFFWYMINFVYSETFNGKGSNSEEFAFVLNDTITKTIPPTSDIDPKLIALGKDTSGNDYSYYSAVIEDIPDDEYQYRFKKLVNLQAEKDAYGNPKKYSGSDFGGEVPSGYVSSDNGATYYKDEGGHLEEVLEVYVIPSANKTNSKVPAQEEGKQHHALPETIEEETKKDSISTIDHDIFINKDNELHKEYYFGNLEQFTFLMDNGAIADKDYDYKAYAFDDTENEDLITLQDLKDKKSASETLTIEEQYMLKHNSIEANLYEDYQRYLGNVGGYCLPKDAVTKDGTVTLPHKDGIDVVIYDENGTHNQRYSEMGECEIYLYMPTTADSRYQNASISLSIGATATQVEYEMDDTGYMLYDKTYVKKQNPTVDTEVAIGDVISIELGIGPKEPNKYRVLDVDGSNVTVFNLTNMIDIDQYDSNNLTSFKDINTDITLDKQGINYYNSTIYDSCEDRYNELEDLNKSLYDAIVPEHFNQYMLDCNFGWRTPIPTPLDILSAFNNDFNINTSYSISKGAATDTIEVVGYNSVGDVYVRTLSMIDIFECLNKLNVELSSTNISLLLDEYVSNIDDIDDVIFSDASYNKENEFFSYYNKQLGSRNCSEDDEYTAIREVFTFDSSLFTDYVNEGSFGNSSQGDKVKIGIVGCFNKVQNITLDPVYIGFMEAMNGKIDEDIEFVYKPIGVQITQDSLSTRISNYNELVNEGCKYIIFELTSSDSKISEILKSCTDHSSVYTYFVGEDYNNSEHFSVTNKVCVDYLPNINDYVSSIEKVMNDSGFVYNLDYDYYYLDFLYNQNDFLDYDADQNLIFSFVNKIKSGSYALNENLNQYKISNNSFDVASQEYNHEHLYEQNSDILCSANLLDLSNYYNDKITAYTEDSKDLPCFIYLDDFYSPQKDLTNDFECYGLYYNYGYICFNIFKKIKCDINTTDCEIVQTQRSVIDFSHYAASDSPAEK